MYWITGCGAFAGDVLLPAYDDDHCAVAGERARATAHGPFSAAFLAERGLPSSLRRVRPRVFLNQLYICWWGCQGDEKEGEPRTCLAETEVGLVDGEKLGGKSEADDKLSSTVKGKLFGVTADRALRTALKLGEITEDGSAQAADKQKKEKSTCEEKQAAAQCTPWASGACVPWDRSSHRIAVTLAGSQSHANARDFHFPHSFYNYYALTWGFRLTIRYIGVNSCNSLSVSHIHKHTHLQTLAWPPATSAATASSSF